MAFVIVLVTGGTGALGRQVVSELRKHGHRAGGSGGLAWGTLRGTQFHTLMDILLRGMAWLPGLMTVPYRWQFQPVDTRDVAVRLVEAVEAGPGGRLPDFGGPQVRDFKSI